MKILFKIIKGIITIFLVIVLALVIFQKITKNKIAIGNIYIFQIASSSMYPEYKVGDVIVVKKTDEASLKIGDDVTYLGKARELNGLIITHRLVEITDENNEKVFVTKGIANMAEDPAISYDDIYGKVIYHTVLFSFVGRLMTNMIIYYILFISVGVGFAYEVISPIVFKDGDE